MDSTAGTAELALLLEVAGTPTPGNVDRERDLPALSFEQFLAGATGARPGFRRAAEGGPFGEAFEEAIRGMAACAGTNTQFGAILLLTPLVRAAGTGALTPDRARKQVETAGVEGAVGFYRAFDHVAVNVPPPPADVPDVRQGSDAIATLRDRELSLSAVLTPAADRGGIATELLTGFDRTFEMAADLGATDAPLSRAVPAVQLRALETAPDPLIVTAHDAETAQWVQQRAATLAPPPGAADIDLPAVRSFARTLVDRGINPGTTADLVAGGLFVALEREEVTLQ